MSTKKEIYTVDDLRTYLMCPQYYLFTQNTRSDVSIKPKWNHYQETSIVAMELFLQQLVPPEDYPNVMSSMRKAIHRAFNVTGAYQKLVQTELEALNRRILIDIGRLYRYLQLGKRIVTAGKTPRAIKLAGVQFNFEVIAYLKANKVKNPKNHNFTRTAVIVTPYTSIHDVMSDPLTHFVNADMINIAGPKQISSMDIFAIHPYAGLYKDMAIYHVRSKNINRQYIKRLAFMAKQMNTAFAVCPTPCPMPDCRFNIRCRGELSRNV